jgi:hypothetical protein
MINKNDYYFKIEQLVNKYIEDRNLNSFSNSILMMIKDYGYVHVPKSSSYELFYFLSKEIGNIIHSDDIKVHKDGAYAAYRSTEVLPHTDTADAHIMGWWCQAQDDIDGTSLIIDTNKLLSAFTRDEQAILKVIKLRYSSENHRTQDQFLKFDEVPLLYEKWGSPKVNYAPWMELVAENSEQEKVISKFNLEMKRICIENITAIRLEEGDFLFIDNGRFLHSRKEVGIDSKRCLRRVWIKTEGAI